MQFASWAPLTAFTAALVSTWWLVRGPFSRIALDRPNQRSLHQVPVPRTGGLGVHVGIIVAIASLSPTLPGAVWGGYALLLCVSFFDDVRGLHVVPRLCMHLLAAAACAIATLAPDYSTLAIAVTALAIAWTMNLFNFMDGSDGLAGGMAFIGFTVYGVAAWFAGSTSFAVMNFSIASAAAAFLVFNFHPARIFLGDVGAVPLGFLVAGCGLVGWLQRDWAWWFPVLVFSPFVADASVTLLRRLVRRERVWEAHRDHYYQRLVQLGWGHRRTAFAEYALMLACGGTALIALSLPLAGQAAVLSAAVAVYCVLIAVVTRRWNRFRTGRTQ